MPIKATKILNPIGVITLDVITLNDDNKPQQETLMFWHRMVTAGAWAESQHKKPEEKKLDTPEPGDALDTVPAEAVAAAVTEALKEQAEKEAFLASFDPDTITDEQLEIVLTKLPVVKEVLDFLVGWDIIGDDDKPLPVTARNLLKLDLKLIRQMSTAHYQASFPNWTT